MKPYSMDLRERAVAACDTGAATQAEVAARFDIGISTLRNWLRLRRETGSLAPLPIGGSETTLGPPERAVLRRLVEATPDATLAALAHALTDETGVALSETTLWREVRRAGLTRKKRRSGPRSSTATT